METGTKSTPVTWTELEIARLLLEFVLELHGEEFRQKPKLDGNRQDQGDGNNNRQSKVG